MENERKIHAIDWNITHCAEKLVLNLLFRWDMQLDKPSKDKKKEEEIKEIEKIGKILNVT